MRAGLYVVAVGGTIILICVQCILHINCKLFNIKRSNTLNVSFLQIDDGIKKVKEIFGVDEFKKINVIRKEKVLYTVSIVTNEISSTTINEIISANDFIISIERCED